MGSSKMSFGVMALFAMMVALMIMAGGVAGQGPAAAPSPDCGSVVVELVDCLAFVSGTVSTPPATCCSNLSAIIENTPQCLCQLYNTTFTEPLGINVTRALLLPPACKLATPAPSLCSLIGVPVPGPVAGPVSSVSPVLAPTATPPSSVPTPGGAITPVPGTAPTATPLSSPPAASMVPPGTTPTAEATPPTTVSPPPNPNSASLPSARSYAAVALLLSAFTILLH